MLLKGRKELAQEYPVKFQNLWRYWIAVFVISLLFLLLFGIAEMAGIPLLMDPSVWLKSQGILPAIIGVLLLVADVWLPVPSSIIMTANGALFGVLIGTILSLVGTIGAPLVGFGIGRAGCGLLRRLVTTPEYETSERLLKQWGILAILVSRPVPILAETVAILAGASSLRWTEVMIASVVGAFPAAFLYALAGATASNMRTGILILPMVLLLASIGRRKSRMTFSETALNNHRHRSADIGVRMISSATSPPGDAGRYTCEANSAKRDPGNQHETGIDL